jgi:S1-C subfamily serine protease
MKSICTTTRLHRNGSAIVMAAAVAMLVSVCLPNQSRGQEPLKPATVRVKTVEAQAVEPAVTATPVVPTARREFRVVDIRPPDIGIWFDPAATDSLLIADIATTGPIAQLGFQEGDRILEVNHVKVNRETDFIKLLFATKERDGRVEVLLIRKNKEMVIVVEPALLIEHYVTVQRDPMEQLGLVVDDRYADRVLVWKVIPRSPAFYAGIRPGDVITRFGDQRVVERKGFVAMVEKVQPGAVAVEVNRAQRTRPIRIEVPRDWTVGYRGPVGQADAPPPSPPSPPAARIETDKRP